MTRTRWLLLGVLAMVAVTAVVLSRRGPAGITVDTVRATRQCRFVSTVTASGEIVATRYADIGSWLPKRVRLTPNSSSAGRRSCSALGCWRLPSSKPPGLLPTTRVRRSPQHVRR